MDRGTGQIRLRNKLNRKVFQICSDLNDPSRQPAQIIKV